MVLSVVSISQGDHRARVLAKRDALVVAHVQLVPPIARRIHARLPASFDLDEMVGVGNLALVKAAMGYDPSVAPFAPYARRCISGAIKDTFRRNKFAEQTRPALLEFPETARVNPALEDRIDLARRFASLRAHVTSCLPPLQVAIFDAYYSPALPEMAEVGRVLGVTLGRVRREHGKAIATLREKMKDAA